MKNFFKLITHNLSLIIFIISQFSILNFQLLYAQWVIQPSGTKANLNSVSFTDPNHGWAVGNNGIILKYSGKQWIKQNSGTKANLNSVSFVDSLNGWAVGDSLKILYYDGNQWTAQNSSITSDPYFTTFTSVHFLNKNYGWAIGYSAGYFHGIELGGSYAIKYNGKQWSSGLPNTSGHDEIWYAIDFKDTLNIYIVGFNWCGWAVFYKYHNRNLTLLDSSNINEGDLNSVFVIDTNNIFVTGDYGTPYYINSNILKFDGKQLTTQYNSVFGFNDIYFVDKNHGWSVGNNSNNNIPESIILKYNGNQWITADTINGYSLSSISFTDTLNGWLVGDGGIILHTTSGGIITKTKNVRTNNFNTGVEIFPNPTNSFINVSCSLFENSSVNISIYDITGRQVLNLINEMKEKGKYKLNFNIDALNNGIYLIKMIKNNTTSVVKLIKI